MKSPMSLALSALCCFSIAFASITPINATAACRCSDAESRSVRAGDSIAYLTDLEPYALKENALLGNTSNGVFSTSSDYTNLVFNVSWDNFIFRTNTITNVLYGASSRDADDMDEQSLKDIINGKISDALSDYMDMDLKNRLAELGRQYWDEHLEEELQNDAHWKEFLKDSLHLNLRALNPVPDMSDLLTEELMAYWTSERLEGDSHWKGFVDQALDLNIKAFDAVPDMSDFLTEELTKYWTPEQLQQSPLWNGFVDDALELNIKAINPVPDISDTLREEFMNYVDEHLEEMLNENTEWEGYVRGSISDNIHEFMDNHEINVSTNIAQYVKGVLDSNLQIWFEESDKLNKFIVDGVNGEIQEYISETEFNFQSNINEWAVGQMEVQMNHLDDHEELWNFILNSLQSEIQKYIDNTDWNLQSNIAEYAESVRDLNLPNDLRDSDKLTKFITDSIFAEIQKYIDTTEYDLQSDIDEWAKSKIALALQNATVTINCITNETYENNYVTNVFTNVYETFETNTVVTVNSITNDVYETTYVTNQVFTENFTTNLVTTENYITNQVFNEYYTTNFVETFNTVHTTNDITENITTYNYITNQVFNEYYTTNFTETYTTNYHYDGHIVDADLYPCQCDPNAISNLQSQIDGIVSCQCEGGDGCGCDLSSIHEELNDLDGRVNDVENNMNYFAGSIYNLEQQLGGITSCECDPQDISDLQQAVSDLQSDFNNFESCGCDTNAINHRLQLLESAVDSHDSFISSIHDIDQRLGSLRFDLEQRIGFVEGSISQIHSCNCNSTSSTPAPREADESIAPEFSTEVSYDIGDVVFYEGKLYECTKEIPANKSFNADSWKPTSVAAMLKEMRMIRKLVKGSK